MKQRQITILIHTNREVIELPTDHNGVTTLYACPTRHIASPNEDEEANLQADYKNFSIKQESSKCGVHEKQNKFV